jgi:hypothetical protein
MLGQPNGAARTGSRLVPIFSDVAALNDADLRVGDAKHARVPFALLPKRRGNFLSNEFGDSIWLQFYAISAS